MKFNISTNKQTTITQNRKTTKTFFLLTSLCFVPLVASADINETKVFLDKYNINKSNNAFSSGIKTNDSIRKNINSGIDVQTFSKIDSNNTDFKINITDNKNIEQANGYANEINSNVRSEKSQQKIQDYKDHILKDKKLGIENAVNTYLKASERGQEEITNGYENKILGKDERLIIAISSSVSKETIKEYFSSLEDSYTDVVFVMNGFIGNNVKYLKPTMEYISDLLVKSETQDKMDKDNRYLHRVDVNPKIFRKYNLKKVPAVVFIKNYNPFLEQQGSSWDDDKKDNSLEEIYISYGDSNIQYALERINKEAKSDGINNLLKKINGGYFNAN